MQLNLYANNSENSYLVVFCVSLQRLHKSEFSDSTKNGDELMNYNFV